MNNWKEITLDKAIKLVGGGTPKTSIDEYWDGDIPWLSVIDFNDDDRWVRKTEKNITKAGLENSSTKMLDIGDLIISARGTVGELAQLKKPMAFNQSCYGIKANENSNINFLYYLLKWKIKNIKKNVHGAVFDTITRNTFEKIDILLPSLPEQKEIAEVLSSLDEKIELLRKQNETLEKIGQGIFKEWFVNFTIDGKKLKLKNRIPEGWKYAKLGEFFPVLTGKRNANHAREKGHYPFFTCSQGSFMCDEYSFDASAILLSGNGDFNLKWFEGKFDAYQRTYVLIPYKKEFIGFLFFAMKYYLNDLTIGQRGSVIKFLTKGMIEDFEISVPNDENILKDISKPFYKILNKIDFNNSQIQTLSRLRDTLLPRLMSGEVKLR